MGGTSSAAEAPEALAAENATSSSDKDLQDKEVTEKAAAKAALEIAASELVVAEMQNRQEKLAELVAAQNEDVENVIEEGKAPIDENGAAKAAAVTAAEAAAAPEEKGALEAAASTEVAEEASAVAAVTTEVTEESQVAEKRARVMETRECDVRAVEVTRRLARNFDGLFPGRKLADTPHTAIALALRTNQRMTAMSTEMISERAECYKILIERMTAFRDHVAAAGYWCDFIDPSSGAPFHSDSPTTFAESDDRVRALGYSILELGCCRTITCKKFGQCLVMTSAFVEAPLENLTEALKLLESDA